MFENYSPAMLRKAVEIELQSNKDPKTAAIIAMRRLEDDPEYYTVNYGVLEKARKMPIGTVSKGRKKIAEGKWIKVKGEIKKVQDKPKDQTETPEFKKWFGNSKVVDSSGKPLVVYHGTQGDFTEFVTRRNIIYFSSEKQNSAMYANANNAKGKILEVYLSIQKPKIVHSIEEMRKAEKTAKRYGYDGIIAKGVKDGSMISDVYIAFSPTQIKSATGNQGTFDPNNPDMTKARPTKYIKKIIVNGKPRYFYTQQQIKEYQESLKEEKEKKSSFNLFTTIKNLFGFKDEKEASKKVQDDYKNNELDKRGVTWDSWKTHLLEYFKNKNKWDALFLKKLEAQQQAKMSAMKIDSLKKEYTIEKNIKKEVKKSSLDMKIMYLIYNIYGGINERNTENGIDIRQRELSSIDKSVSAGRDKSDSLSNVPERTPSSDREIDVLSGSVVRDRPGRDVRLTPSQIKANRKAILDLLASKTDEEMTDEDKELLRQYEGAGGLKEDDKSVHGTLYEYYTPRTVVSKIWDLVKKYTGEGPQTVLEPSAGIGRFAENQPEDFDFTMLELDPISSRINSILFPDADVKNQSFQRMFMKGNAPVAKYTGKKFSVVIGNPPYGSYAGVEKGLGEGSDHTRYEEYFIDRGLDAMEDGGIMAYIVPSGFLRDNKYDDVKARIASKGRLMEAYRLPNGTFQTTGIGTDIIIVRKEKGNVSDFLDDNYFKKNPEHIMGEQTIRTDRFGKPTQYVSLKDGMTFDTAIGNIDAESVPVVPVKKLQPKQEVTEKVKVKTPETNPKAKEKIKSEDNFDTMPDVETDSIESFNNKYNKSFSEEDIAIWKNTQYDGKIDLGKLSSSEKSNLEKNKNVCIDSNGDYYHETNYVSGNIYDKLNDLERARKSIGEDRYGRQKKMLTEALPEYKTTKNFFVSPISDFAKTFNFKDIETGENTAFLDRFFEWATGGGSRHRMNWDGGVTQHDLPSGVGWSDIIDYIEQVPVRASSRGDKATNKYLAEKTKELRRDVAEKLVKRFIESGLNPDEQNQLEKRYNTTYNAYVAPDYSKIPLFLDGISTKFKGHDLVIKEAQIRGASFLCNKGNGYLAYDVGVGKTLTGILATVNQLQTGRAKKPVVCVPKAVYSNWIREIKELFPDIKINELGNLGGKALGGKAPDIKDGTLSIVTYEALGNVTFKEDTINGGLLDDMVDSQEISKEGMSDREKAEAREKIMTLLGKAVKSKKKVLDKGISFNDTTILNKEGFVKSNGMEIDPNSIKAAYDISGNPAILVKEGSNWSLLDARTGLGISLNHSSRTNAINDAMRKLDGKTVEAYKEMLDRNDTANKDVENNFETMPEDEGGDTGAFYFEDLGFDHITVDEVHNFKNIFAAAKPTGQTKSDGSAKQVANEFQGISGSQSARGLKMFAITQLIQKNNDGRNVFALSATPFTNSPLEVYNMLSLTAREKLKELGIYNLHEFMAQFAKMKNEWSIDAKGNIARKTVMKEFQNLPALQNLIREYIDKIDGEEAGIIRPVKNTHICEMEMSPIQKAIYAVELKRFDLKDSSGKPMPGATLVAINNMRQVTVSPSLMKFDELYDGTGIPEMVKKDDFVEDSPKLKFTTDSIAKLYEARPDAGQIMYMPRGVEQYDKVVSNLVKKGIPKNAIATISSGMTDDAKDKIMASFNNPNGVIKVVIGSETIKEGVNLNGNTATVYNTLLGWNPTEPIQVEGRAWRQGNKQGHVHIIYPQLIDSVDSVMYQKHDEKGQRLAQIWSFKGDSLNVEDINAEELKFDLIKDPEKRAKFAMDLELEQIDDNMREKRIFIDTLTKYQSDYQSNDKRLERLDDAIKADQADVVTAENEVTKAEQDLKEFKKIRSKEKDGSDYTYSVEEYERKIKYAKEKLTSEKKYLRDAEREKKMAQQTIEGVVKKLNDMGINFGNIEKRIANEKEEVSKLHQKTVDIKNNKDEYVKQAKAEIEAKQRTSMPKMHDVVNNNVAAIRDNMQSAVYVLESGEINKNKFFKNSQLQKALFLKRFNPETHEFEYRILRRQ